MAEHYHDQLAYYGDLTPDERRAVDAHLAACAECQATWAAYRRQDAALEALPRLRPRPSGRRWSPGASAPARPSLRWAVARLGDALALGGLAALLWLFALQVQGLAAGGAGTLTPAALEPGLTLPPTRLQPPSPWLDALPWLAAALLAVGLLFILTRRSLVPTFTGLVLAGLLLTGFVSPFSLVPNPVALAWRVVGGYSYDPRLPFKNDFLIAGSPARELRPYLDQLIGQTGLSPLDPNQPLARYEILRVSLHPVRNRVALVTTRFIYADGSSRVYPVPLLGPAVDVGGFWLAGWRADGLERLRSQHLAFPEQPFATETAPLRLGAVQALALHPEANRLDEINPGHWLWDSVRVERLVAAPDGSGFLAAVEPEAGLRQLWWVPFDGTAPALVAPVSDIREYGWSPDSRTIVYTRFDPEAAAVDIFHAFAIVSVPRDQAGADSASRTSGATTLATGLSTDQLPGLTDAGVWFFHSGQLWLAPSTGGVPVVQRSEISSNQAPRPSPDGRLVAYAQAGRLCLADLADGGEVCLDDVAAAELTWSPDGQRLAVVDRDVNNLRPVRLVIVSAAGALQAAFEIAPRDVTDPPQWTPDGGAVLIQTFPQDGRRIIAVDLASGQVLDLSREHWDAYFTLLPGGEALLLNNGRGGYWRAELVR